MFSELTLFKALCVLSICACCFPLYWHIKTANVPAVCLAVWFIVVNLCNLINVFIWGDVNIFTAWEGRVFCDIQVKILIAAAAGKMGAVAAITRNLANIMRDDLPVVKTRAMKRRALVEDLMLCFGVSIWMMGIHYVVQPDRYWLIGVKGCTASIDNSWPSIVLVHIWPPIICAAAVSYCLLVFIRIHRYQSEFEKILTTSSSPTTRSRFYRLYSYCIIIILVLLPTTIYILYRNLSVPRISYDWAAIHDPYEWSYIFKIPSEKVQFDAWISVVLGILLFVFFGLGHDAMMMYTGWAKSLKLDLAWERMRKRKLDKQRGEGRGGNKKGSQGSGWSGSTKFGSASRGIMESGVMESRGDKDEISEAIPLEEATMTSKSATSPKSTITISPLHPPPQTNPNKLQATTIKALHQSKPNPSQLSPSQSPTIPSPTLTVPLAFDFAMKRKDDEGSACTCTCHHKHDHAQSGSREYVLQNPEQVGDQGYGHNDTKEGDVGSIHSNIFDLNKDSGRAVLTTDVADDDAGVGNQEGVLAGSSQ